MGVFVEIKYIVIVWDEKREREKERKEAVEKEAFAILNFINICLHFKLIFSLDK